LVYFRYPKVISIMKEMEHLIEAYLISVLPGEALHKELHLH